MRLMVKKLLPFALVEDKEFRVLFQACTKDFPMLSVERVRHIMVEMYSATKAVSARDACCMCTFLLRFVVARAIVIVNDDVMVQSVTGTRVAALSPQTDRGTKPLTCEAPRLKI